MKIEINGHEISDEKSFHIKIAAALSLPEHYGKNLDALWDTLSTDIQRPICLIWKNSNASQKMMPHEFEQIVKTLRRVEQQDTDWKLNEKFQFELV
jgi:ribonuclease inhibitor